MTDLVPLRARAARFALAILLVAPFAFGAGPKSGRSGRLYTGNGTGEPAFTFESLVSILQEKKPKTVEETIAALPQGLRNRYVLMYRSRSLQAASFREPRAILFEGDGSFLLSFNGGGREMRGFDKIEAIQFREDKRAWEFREIDFAPAAGQSGPRVSEPNPRKCLECHQSARRLDVDPRPNWEPYSNWPGAYAGVDGRIGDTLEGPGNRDKVRPEDAPIVAEQKAEQGEFDAFMRDTKPWHARYALLGPFVTRAALDLTDILVGNNALRVARLAAVTPDWDVYRDLYLDSMTCFDYSQGYGFAGKGKGPGGIVPSATPDELLPILEPAASRLVPTGVRGGLGNAQRMSFFFESRGIDTSDWSMDFRTGGRFAFRDRFGSPSSPDDQMRNGFAETFGYDAVNACRDARARLTDAVPAWRQSGRLAQVAAAGVAAQGAMPAPIAPASQLNRCARCHAGADISAPPIPFDDLRALRARFAEPGYARGTLFDEISYRLSDMAVQSEQMPPSSALTPDDRRSMIEFLRGLR